MSPMVNFNRNFTDISSVPKFKVVGSRWILAIFVYEKHTELFTYGNLECIK